MSSNTQSVFTFSKLSQKYFYLADLNQDTKKPIPYTTFMSRSIYWSSSPCPTFFHTIY